MAFCFINESFGQASLCGQVEDSDAWEIQNPLDSIDMIDSRFESRTRPEQQASLDVALLVNRFGLVFLYEQVADYFVMFLINEVF